MANTENKVQFNLKNTHYAKLTFENGIPKWGTPVKIPGAVSLSLNPQGEVKPFYADGIVFYQTVSNNGYSGDLEVARFPDQMLKDIWGFGVDTNKVIVERANVQASAFALLYQIDGDADDQLYCLYNCSATRPNIGGSTTTEIKEPKTQSSSISAVPLENNNVMARTTFETTAEVRSNWFKAVYTPEEIPEETPEESVAAEE